MRSSDLIFAMFGSRDPQTRSLALKYSDFHITDKKQLANLVVLGLQDPEPVVRLEAYQIMDKVYDFLEIDSMIRNETNAALRNAAISFLTDHSEEKEDYLIRLLDDRDKDVVLFTTQIISKKPTEKMIQATFRNLYCLDTNIVQATIEVMVSANEKSAIPILHKLLSQDIWLELVILEALVKLGDHQVYQVIEDRLRPNSEQASLIFEVVKSNPSYRFLKILFDCSREMIHGHLSEDFLVTFTSVVLKLKYDQYENQRFLFGISESGIHNKPTVVLEEKDEEVRIAIGILTLWGILDDENWNVSEWIDLVHHFDTENNISNLLRESDWTKIFSRLSQDSFSISVLQFFAVHHPEHAGKYLNLHPRRLKVQLNTILEMLVSSEVQLPFFMIDVIGENIETIPAGLMRKLIRLNHELLQFHEKILTHHTGNLEIAELIFDEIGYFEITPAFLIEQVAEFVSASDFQKRMAAVKAAFSLHKIMSISVLDHLLNDPILEVRVKAFQNARDLELYDLIDDVVIAKYIDSVEVFYLSRWISSSPYERHAILMARLYENSSGQMKDQLGKIISSKHFQLNRTEY